MPPLPIITDVHRVALTWATPGAANAVNVMHFRAPTLTAAQVLTAIDANVTAAMWGMTGSVAHVTTLHGTPLDGTSATAVLAVSGAKWTGLGSSGDYSVAATVVQSLRSAFRGRSARGRIYHPFPAEIDMSNGVFTGSLSGAQTAWNTFRSAMVTAGAEMVIASYKTASFHSIVSTVIETILGTQRRRQTRLRP